MRTVVVPTDVSDENAVQELADRAMLEFGHIDIWNNNAGVYMMGEIKNTPVDAMRRLNRFGRTRRKAEPAAAKPAAA